jgi:hypothetical protein
MFHVIEKLDKLWLNTEHNREMPKQANRFRFAATKSQMQSRNYELFMKPEG